MKNYFILVLIVLISSALCNERTFNLKSGNKVKGEIVNIDDSGTYTVNTSMGEVVFNQNEIVLESVKIITTVGDRIVGVLQSEDNDKFYVKTEIGLMSIEKNNVNSIDFHYNDKTSDDSFFNSLGKSDKRFYFGDEELIDVWFDPTGNVLPDETIYVSGLSIAYGLTEKFQVSLRVWDFIQGNVNIRPKYQIYKKGGLEKTNTLSIGAHFYLTGAVAHKWKSKVAYRQNYIPGGYYGDGDVWVDGHFEETEIVDHISWELITSDEFSYELFFAYTTSKLRPSNQGRINYNLGTSISKIDEYSEFMNRTWFGADIDVRKKLKLTGLIAYDPYLPTTAELIESSEQTDIHVDFGFIYSHNDNFRLGLHLTSPFIGFYWKF